MTSYEFLTLVTAIVALIVSTISLIRSRKLAEDQLKLVEEQLKLEQVTAELSRLQIKIIAEQDSLKTKPLLNVAITKTGTSSYFVIANRGQGSALDLDMELVDCLENPLMNEVNQKLPFPKLRPNVPIKLRAAFHMSSALKYQVKLTWREIGDDERKEEVFWVSR